MKLRTSKRLEATAHHEAGHTIIAWKLKILVPLVTIQPQKGSLGITRRSNPMKKEDFDEIEFDLPSPQVKRRAENDMIISLAGPVAQRKHNPQSVRSSDGADDRASVFGILYHLCGQDPEELRTYYLRMELKARALVQNPANWRAIKTLAKELLRRRTLSGPELQQFILRDCFKIVHGKKSKRKLPGLNR